jgi:transposase
LIFLDESGAKTNMTRLRGRALRGQRVHASAPAGHWKTLTIISSIRLDGSTTAMAIPGATDTDVFRAYVSEVLCPALRPGDVVIMDNLRPHKSEPTLELIAATGAEVLFLPPYRPISIPSKKCGARSNRYYAALKLELSMISSPLSVTL